MLWQQLRASPTVEPLRFRGMRRTEHPIQLLQCFCENNVLRDFGTDTKLNEQPNVRACGRRSQDIRDAVVRASHPAPLDVRRAEFK